MYVYLSGVLERLGWERATGPLGRAPCHVHIIISSVPSWTQYPRNICLNEYPEGFSLVWRRLRAWNVIGWQHQRGTMEKS